MAVARETAATVAVDAVRAGGTPPVRMEDVTKHYPGGGGVDGVSLDVASGEVFAFLGPNGAGKTTTIRLLLDLIRPDRGRITLFGLDPRRRGVTVRRRLGYLPGELGLYEHLTGRELLTHFAHLRRGPSWSRIAELVDAFALDVDRPIRALSKGNRQKVGLIQALMGDPDLLILDEPTSGLDPLVQHQVHDAIRAAARAGRSVFLSSHVLPEVAQVADRVGIIDDGRVVAVQRVEDLRAASVHHVDVRFADDAGAAALAAVAGVTLLASSDGAVHAEVAGPLDPVIAVLSRHRVADLAVREPDLEEMFLGLVGRAGRALPGGGGDGAA